jgi:hypothetical protein
VPKKQPIKRSPLRSGRRVRWTFEVSADVGAENRARVKKPAKKRKRARPIAQLASPSPHPHVHAGHDSVTSSTTETVVPAAAPVVATRPAVEPTSPVLTAPVMQPTPPWQPTGGQMVVLAGIAVLVIATVAVPLRAPASDTLRSQQPEERESAAAVAKPLSATAAPAAPVAAMARPLVKTLALTESPKKSSVQNATNRTAEPIRPSSLGSVAANDNIPMAKGSTTEPVLPEPIPAAPSSASAANLSPTTITGCLEISTDGNEFRLADTEGADAPKSRNWRTGFLRKRTAPIALVGVTDPLALKKSVGKRVAATGLLTSRELQVSSLRSVGSSCN